MLRRRMAGLSAGCALLFGAAAAGTVAAKDMIEHGPYHGPQPAAARLGIQQTLSAWAQNRDSGNNAAAAAMFTPTGTIKVAFNDTDANPITLQPTGYSPASTPSAGTPGGGCSVSGTAGITGFLAGMGSTWGPSIETQDPSPFRWYITNTLVDYPQAERYGSPITATARSYAGFYNSLNLSPSTLIFESQLLTQMRYQPGIGWRISEMDVILDQPDPTFPCED